MSATLSSCGRYRYLLTRELDTDALTLSSGRHVWIANAIVRAVAFATAAFLLALASMT